MAGVEYVDLSRARDARGIRIITSAAVPSPWSEAAKGLFVVGKLPALVVAKRRGDTEIQQWTGIDNVPIVLHNDEPARTNWAAIVALAARLAGSDVLLPATPGGRAEAFGLLELMAGEDGLGWTSRLAMIHTSLESSGARGFPMPIAVFLANRYGYAATLTVDELRRRFAGQLAVLRERLTTTYFGGERPSAVDVYLATFLTPLGPIDDSICPQMTPALRQTFGTAAELLGDLVPSELWALHARMVEEHLPRPIRLS